MHSLEQSCTDTYQISCQASILRELQLIGKKLHCLESRSDLYAGCPRDEDRQREIRKEMERSDRRGTI